MYAIGTATSRMPSTSRLYPDSFDVSPFRVGTNASEIGVDCLDWRGMIVQANTRPREILRDGDGLVDRGGFLRARLATTSR